MKHKAFADSTMKLWRNWRRGYDGCTGWAFYVGSDIVGFVLGEQLILLAAVASTTNFCIPSFIYNSVVGRRDTLKEPAGVG